MKAYISIHDVSPRNLNDVENIISRLDSKFNINKISILVIPGLNWKKKQLDKIKSWQNNGIQIAAHGWLHKSKKIKTIYHKLHSLIISAKCAEHLSKNRQDINRIISNSYNWFIENDFQRPYLYVPPAWALGKINRKDLQKLNFTHFECTTGFIHNNKYRFLPLIGFEEKFLWKSLLRRFFNSFNFMLASFTGVVRIAIHPNDFNLYLKNDIEKYLNKCDEAVLLNELG